MPTPTPSAADAGGAFDPTKPYATRDGTRVSRLVPHTEDGRDFWLGYPSGGCRQRWDSPSGFHQFHGNLDLVNDEPTPAPPAGGEAPQPAAGDIAALLRIKQQARHVCRWPFSESPDYIRAEIAKLKEMSAIHMDVDPPVASATHDAGQVETLCRAEMEMDGRSGADLPIHDVFDCGGSPDRLAWEFYRPQVEQRLALYGSVGASGGAGRAGTMEVSEAEVEEAVQAVRDVLWRDFEEQGSRKRDEAIVRAVLARVRPSAPTGSYREGKRDGLLRAVDDWCPVEAWSRQDHERVLLYVPAWRDGQPVRLGAWLERQGSWTLAGGHGIMPADIQPSHVRALPEPPRAEAPTPPQSTSPDAGGRDGLTVDQVFGGIIERETRGLVGSDALKSGDDSYAGGRDGAERPRTSAEQWADKIYGAPAEGSRAGEDDVAFVERHERHAAGLVNLSAEMAPSAYRRLIALARLGATRPSPDAGGDVGARIAAEREACAAEADLLVKLLRGSLETCAPGNDCEDIIAAELRQRIADCEGIADAIRARARTPSPSPTRPATVDTEVRS